MPIWGAARLRAIKAIILVSILSVLWVGAGCEGIPVLPGADSSGEDRTTLFSTLDDEETPADNFRIVFREVESKRWNFSVETIDGGIVGTGIGLRFVWDFDDSNGRVYEGDTQRINFQDPGAHTVTVTAFRKNDSIAFVLTLEVDISIPNTPPVAEAGSDRSVFEGDTVCLEGAASYDANGDDLEYAWRQIAGQSVTLTPDPASASNVCFIAPEVTADERFIFSLSVSDGEFDVEDTLAVDVLNALGAAGTVTADAGEDQTVLAGATVMLDGSLNAGSSGEVALAWGWEQISGATVNLLAPDELGTTFVAPSVIVEDVLVFRLTVSQGDAVADDVVRIITLPQINGGGVVVGGGGGGVIVGGDDPIDDCPNDPNKIAPGVCGCGVADDDTDGDGVADCNDACPDDLDKTSPELCGCGVADVDADGDSTPDCNDACPNDPAKTSPGACGCGVSDADSDSDGTADCNDGCPNDPAKTVPGTCGCGVSEVDSDGDGSPDCVDPPNTVALSENFDGTCGGEPADWFDTGANNSMTQNKALFANTCPGGQSAFGTASTLTNVHSHYVGAGASAWTEYTYQGRFMLDDATGGVGMTFLSDYPNSDTYYRLRRHQWITTLHISPSAGVAIPQGVIDTGVDPLPNQWYRFKIEISDTGTQTNILAKVWLDGSAEPSAWQVNCFDSTGGRLTSGTVGVWSMGAGQKHWDDFNVTLGGCSTDTDGDGVADCNDQCPGEADADDDGDGVVNCKDQCPGAPDTDSDGDTVPDCVDACPGADDLLDSDGNGTPNCLETGQLCTDTTNLNFGFSTSTLAVDTWNCGGGTVAYTITDDADWLTVSPTSGSSSGGGGGGGGSGAHNFVSATVDRSWPGLAGGTHTAEITMTPSVGTVITALVSMSVGTGAPMSTAHRTSGVAPLSVFFDVLKTTSQVAGAADGDDAGRFYEWDFGDGSAGTWSTDGRSRNRAIGYVATHVYETDGTYAVTLTVVEKDGASSTYQQTITVSPFTGTTYYVSSSDPNRSDSGPGTQAQPLASFQAAIARAGANVRLRFKRGDTWSMGTPATLNAIGPGIMEAYGSGAKPKIRMTASKTGFKFESSDWRLIDMAFEGPGGSSTEDGISGRTNGAWTNALILRCKVSRFRTGIGVSRWVGAKTYNAIVDCLIENMNNKGIYFGGEPLAILGNTVRNTGSHAVRLWMANKSVLANNDILNPGSFYPCLKFHSTPFADGQTQSQFCVLSYNTFQGGNGSSNGQTLVALEPQNAQSDERVSDIVVEGNVFKAGKPTRDCLAVHARRVTVRNNVFNFDNGPTSGDLKGVNIIRRGIEPAPVGTRVYNNTFYRGTSTSGQSLAIYAATSASDTIVRNTLLSTPASASVLLQNFSSGMVQSNNQRIDAAGFINTDSGDFRLQAGSAAIDAGYDVGVARDQDGNPRSDDPGTPNQGSGTVRYYDLGACEYQAP